MKNTRKTNKKIIKKTDILTFKISSSIHTLYPQALIFTQPLMNNSEKPNHGTRHDIEHLTHSQDGLRGLTAH